MSSERLRGMGRLNVGLLLAILAVLVIFPVVVFKVSSGQADSAKRDAYAGDIDQWIVRLQGCENTKRDRRLDRQGWATARAARLGAARDPKATQQTKAVNLAAAAGYKLIVDDYRQRIEGLDCVRARPAPSTPNGVTPSPMIGPTIAWAREAERDAIAVERRIRRARTPRR